MTETYPDAGPAWRWACRIAPLLCAPLAVFAAYDSAIAYWATQPSDAVPVALRDNAQLHWTELERRSIDPVWMAANADRVRTAALAQLRASPLDASALRELGLIASAGKSGAGTDAGLALFRAAEHVSRRDGLNQLALIRTAEKAGNMADGMRHYDRILMIAPAAEDRLFPTLAKAIGYPEVREPLATFAARPWFVRFVGRAFDLGADPAAVFALYTRGLRAMNAKDRQAVGLTLTKQLVDRGDLPQARTIVATIPGIGPALRDQFALTAMTVNPSLAPLAWRLTNDEAVETSITPPGRLTIRISGGRSAIVAERLMLAPPGSYAMSHDVEYDAGEAVADLTWTVTCKAGKQLAVLRVPAKPGRSRFSARIDVPADCGAQSWQLSATPEDIQSTSSVTIDHLSLVP
jgi:hypothetical protein